MRNRTFRRAGAITGVVLASTLAAGATAQAATAAPANDAGKSQTQEHKPAHPAKPGQSAKPAHSAAPGQSKPGHPAKPGTLQPSKQRGEVTGTAVKTEHGKKVTVLRVADKGAQHTKRTWVAPESAKVVLNGKPAKAGKIATGDHVRAAGFQVPAKVAKQHHQKNVSVARSIAAHSER